MGTPTRAMLRLRASSLTFGNAATSVLRGSGRMLVLLASGEIRTPSLALHRAASCASLSTPAASFRGSVCSQAPFCFPFPSAQVFGETRRYASSYSSQFARKPATKRGSVPKRGGPRKASGTFQRANAVKRPGSAGVYSGSTFRKPVSALKYSKKKFADFDEDRQSTRTSVSTERSEFDNKIGRKPVSALKSSKKKFTDFDADRQSTRTSVSTERSAFDNNVSKRTSASTRKPSFVPKAISKTAFRKNREKLRQEMIKRNEIDSPKQKEEATPFRGKELNADNRAVETQIRKKNNTKSKAVTEDEEEIPRKRGKRVMRLDPKDTTAKRYFEGYPLPGEEVTAQEETPKTPGRVQFRSIVPPEKIMQHIQRHMIGRRRPAELQRAGYDLRISPAPLDNVPFSKRGERQPTQEEIFTHKLRFAAAAKVANSFPPPEIPEVAFAGRSNVGKSSLINALTRQWGVARTSDKPGLTQSINFFRLGGRLCLVDLPGYGFAYAKEEKKEAWEELVKEFVTTRNGLKRVYLLVDAKWGLKIRDEELVELMERAGTKYQIVLTKTDTVTPIDLGRRVTQIQEIFKANRSLVLPMIMVSSKTGEGLEFFRSHVARLSKGSLI